MEYYDDDSEKKYILIYFVKNYDIPFFRVN